MTVTANLVIVQVVVFLTDLLNAELFRCARIYHERSRHIHSDFQGMVPAIFLPGEAFAIIVIVEITHGRDLRRDLGEIADPRDPRDPNMNTGLLLSALCIEDGQLRNACLENISSLSIQKFLDRLVEQIKDNERYTAILRQLDISNKDDVLPGEEPVPQKRERSRNTSGFYSNW